MRILVFIFTFWAGFFWSQNDFEKANQFYLEKNFDSAIFYYQQLEKTSKNEAVFYNLANAFYQKKELGFAILYFEKALLIAPFASDIKKNLAFVNAEKADLFERQDFDKSLVEKIALLFTASFWKKGSYFFVILGWILVFVFGYKKHKIFLFAGIYSLIFSFFPWYLADQNQTFLQNSPYAIVLQNNSILYKEPAFNADELYTLHEGSKLKILAENKDFFQVLTLSDQKGWIKKESLGKIQIK